MPPGLSAVLSRCLLGMDGDRGQLNYHGNHTLWSWTCGSDTEHLWLGPKWGGVCVGCVHHDRPAGWNMVIIVNIRLSQGFLWDGENVLELDSSDG